MQGSDLNESSATTSTRSDNNARRRCVSKVLKKRDLPKGTVTINLVRVTEESGYGTARTIYSLV